MTNVAETRRPLSVDEEDERIETPDWVNAKAVGWQLGKLWVRRDRTPDQTPSRERHLDLSEAQAMGPAFQAETRLSDVQCSTPHMHDVRTSELSETSDGASVRLEGEQSLRVGGHHTRIEAHGISYLLSARLLPEREVWRPLVSVHGPG